MISVPEEPLLPTISVDVPVMVPDVAVMVVVPALMPVASPLGDMVATWGMELVKLTLFTNAIDPSLFMPVAVNCIVPPTGIDPFWGLIRMDVSVSGTKNPLHEINASSNNTEDTSSGTLICFAIAIPPG